MKDILTLAHDAALAAGQLLLHPPADLKVQEKGRFDLVTEVDTSSEQLITEMVHARFPDHELLGEEGDHLVNLDAEHLWIVDPLDGTNNFVHGIPQFSVSIAYARRGEVVAGVIHDPCRGETFTASKGAGAHLNGRPIKVSGVTSLAESIVATGFYYDRGRVMEATLASIHALFRHGIHGIRRFGSAALDLAWIAYGRCDGFFEYKLSPWDFAAGSLLIQEAGGRCSDCLGDPLTLNSAGMIGANPLVYEQLVEVVRWDGGARHPPTR